MKLIYNVNSKLRIETAQERSIEDCMKLLSPECTDVHIVEDDAIPKDRSRRDEWRLVDGRVEAPS